MWRKKDREEKLKLYDKSNACIYLGSKSSYPGKKSHGDQKRGIYEIKTFMTEDQLKTHKTIFQNKYIKDAGAHMRKKKTRQDGNNLLIEWKTKNYLSR